MKPHKHAELIKAWADGQAEVEYRYPKDDGSLSLWKNLTQCVFHEWYEYRIKPAITQNNTQLHPVKELTDEEWIATYRTWLLTSNDPLVLKEAILRKAQE